MVVIPVIAILLVITPLSPTYSQIQIAELPFNGQQRSNIAALRWSDLGHVSHQQIPV